ncbi:MAG: CapA family protein [Melioribacter sp.]|nr:CapA family protein [Melioribacter sp.]
MGSPNYLKNNFVKVIVIISFVIIYSYLFLYNGNLSNYSIQKQSIRIKLNFVGDIMCHLPQIEYAKINSLNYDFKPTFKYIKEYLENADLTFGNLETVIGKTKDEYKGYPYFNSPPELLEALKYAGFDVLFTSNNHSFDQGFGGLINTIDAIKKQGMISIGTYYSKKDYDSLKIISLNNIKIGLLAYTYGLNINPGKTYNFVVKIIDSILIKKEIEKLKQKKTDLILVYFHFGNEYQRKPSTYQEEIVDKTLNYGADVIVASHPHVVQRMMFVNKNHRKKFVAYSLGNFLSNQRWRYSDSGVILSIIISKDIYKNEISLDSIFVIPIWVYKGKECNKNKFLILPSDTSKLVRYNFLSNNDKEIIKRSYEDIMGIISLNVK